MDLQAGYSECEFEARFSLLRTEETNLGNFMADLFRSELQADFGLCNGGALRANAIIPQGRINFRFISDTSPMIDTIMLFKVTGL